MKIRFYSDLHLEFGKFKIPPGDDNTVLVLAGDIGVGLSAWPLIEKACQSFKAVVYVLGNHEYYNRVINEVQRKWREKDLDNFYFLENDSVVIDGITFLGCTLWTDIRGGDPYYKAVAEYAMQDYKSIKTESTVYGWNGRKETRLTATDTIRFHNESLAWLKDQKMDSSTVVVTHHSPSSIFLDLSRHGRSNLNPCYYSNLEGFILEKQPGAWICGHTHKFVDDILGDTRLLSNPRGYVGYQVVPMFNPHKEIEIEPLRM